MDMFLTVKMCFNYFKKGLGDILDDFFANASGHPGRNIDPRVSFVIVFRAFQFFVVLFLSVPPNVLQS
jgi:hypothetical protein